MSKRILEIQNLKKYFPVKTGKTIGLLKAVDDVSFVLEQGQTLGLVGESGCGKSTLVNTILNLIKPTEGKVIFDEQDMFSLNKKELKNMRRDIQIVFQDPFWSLNPRMLVKDIIAEPLYLQTKMTSSEIMKKVYELIDMVNLEKHHAYKYPHEFSGGQRQRIAIARALALTPKLVVLDEPTSSIDIISQNQIIDLLEDLKRQFALSYIIISHDLSVVSTMSDKIAVMYLGKIVEYGDAETVIKTPFHPYTQALFSAIPSIYTESLEEIKTLEGTVPSAIDLPSGCRFHTRCSFTFHRCREEEPVLQQFSDNHFAACHLKADSDVLQ